MNVQKSTVRDFLSRPNTYYRIPVYQRNFCWQTAQCRMFFDDICDCIEQNKTHFIGTMVYKQEENENIIIDGQQRITSVSLLLKALYEATSNETLRKQINEKYLLNPCDDGKYKLKLKPIKRDSGVYKKLLSHYHVNDAAFSSSEMGTPLYTAFVNYCNWVKEMMSEPGFDSKLMSAIESLELVELSLTGENPQEIFESINATGMTLSSTDILRNYLLMPFEYKEQVRLYEEYWLPIEERVGTENIDEFISAWLIVTYHSSGLNICGKTLNFNSQTLVSIFKYLCQKGRTIENIEQMLYSIKVYSAYYRRCLRNAGITAASSSELDGVLHELCFMLDALSLSPIYIYVLNDVQNGVISESCAVETLKVLVGGLTRSKVCGGSMTHPKFDSLVINRMEKGREAYAGDNANEVYLSTFIKAISSGHGEYAYPSDFVFEQALLNPTIKMRTQLLKYLLFNIEKYINKDCNMQFSSGSVEHIMPQTLSSEWQRYLSFNGCGDIHDQYVNAIGNLSLTESNSALSNKSFEDKKKIYTDSGYKITKDLCNVAVWTKGAIEARGKRMVDIALKIWQSPNITPANHNIVKHTLFDDLTLFTGQKPASFSFLGEEVPCDSWTALGVGVMNIIVLMDENLISDYIDSEKAPYINILSHSADDKRQASQLINGIWFNQVKNPAKLLKNLKTLLQTVSGPNHSLVEELWFTLDNQDDDDDIVVMVDTPTLVLQESKQDTDETFNVAGPDACGIPGFIHK